MALPFAVAADLAERWRPLSPAETSRADVLLADASHVVRRRVPEVDARIIAGTLDPDTVEIVVTSMVKRVMMVDGRDGVVQTSDTTGPFATSATYTNPQGNLYLSTDELLLLGGVTVGPAFTLDLGSMAP